MRFILGFVFFGLLFYAISYYSPDTFQTLVSWAAKTFDYLREFGEGLAERLKGTGTGHPPTPTEPIKSLFLAFLAQR